MSQVKLTLRPPPNVDFVYGYPGIPPGAPDRPQAAVKGAIEVRVGPQGVKAQWVRIALRKVETLPGGGQSNTYFDFVGPSPVNLWTSSEDYAMLHTQDFPFYIRIPESIPPSIALEKNAGIRYELIASVCVKGKKGFLRRRKSVVTSTMASLIIDKHELHSTWPVYQQPETRHLAQEGVNLTVDRAQTCYGPGDRVSVMATLKSDSLHTVILRGFEFTLKETSVFRAGPNSTKKGAPQVKVTVIGEQKVPVNATLYGGTQHKAELACIIPKDHTTTSLNAARHIDITYMINVKALMGTGTHLIMDLPVIVSNWPRAVSIEAIRRIGTAPSLSLHTGPGHSRQSSAATSELQRPTTANSRTGGAGPGPSDMYSIPESAAPPRPYNTAPNAQRGAYTNGPGRVDEFGYSGAAAAGYGRPPQSAQTVGSRPNGQAAIGRPIDPRRPGSMAANQRFTVTNFDEMDLPRDDDSEGHGQGSSSVQARAPPSPPKQQNQQWLSAEEEKRRLYESARAKVERVQGGVLSDRSDSPPATTSPRTPPGQSRWLTAEQEKTRLFEQAQAAAKQTQGYSSYSPPSTSDPGELSRQQSAGSLSSNVSPGAALYSQAMSSLSRNTTASSLPSPPQRSPPPAAPVPQYRSAEEEKAALKRYHEAKLAVDRTQNAGFSDGPSNPTAYESLYPNAPASYAGGSGLPPAFGGPSHPPSALEEKERLRRAYEAQDAASSQPPPAAPSSPPGYSVPPAPSGQAILSEKEQLRRRYEAQDAAAAAAAAPPASAPAPPPRGTSLTPSSNPRPVPRSPVLPSAPSNGRPLTAAEEKAQLKARYDAEDAGSAPPKGDAGPPPPPPLMPRPPVDYIQETQAVDAHISSLNGTPGNLEVRPFTPFSNGFHPEIAPPPPPPKFS
ncbi:hypothetical protein PLICRDRAFT_618065 [Plicaturopsis crispa FD-325 SS-3]|nr:hypothetical protein PLICRDRAFT_618065 [Plicaturopsis crispa FD-325 SS-3]